MAEDAATEGRATIESLIDAINAHDPDRACELFDAAARVVTATGRQLDRHGIHQLLSTTMTAFPDGKVNVERWVVQGDTVVTEEVLEGTHRGPFAGLAPSGRRVRIPMVHVARVVDHHIVERIAYHDTAAMLRQLAPNA